MNPEAKQGIGSDPVDSLLQHLGIAEDERAVYSAIYRREEEGASLLYASLLIGPEEMAAGSWGAWMLNGAERLTERFQSLAKAPAQGLVESAPVQGSAEVLAGRFSVGHAQMRSWLRGVLDAGVLPKLQELPEASAKLLAPTAPLHIFPRLWTPVSRLAATTIRPLRGFFFPLAEQPAPLVARDWRLGGVTAHDGPWPTLGIALPNEGHSFEPPPAGLLVGRLERRAWFNDVRGDGAFERYELHVGIEPERTDVSELEVELEEWSKDEIVNSRRIALGDLKLGQRAGTARFLVSLPTLGRGFAHVARLYDREGVLLDRTQRARLVERVIGKARYRGPGGATGSQDFEIGERIEVGLEERLARFDRLDENYRQMLQEGLEERIISGPGRANVLSDELARVSKPLSILDPYFGYSPSDWNSLAGLSVPVRVLTGRGAKPASWGLPNVEMRRWRGTAPNPPFHDRFYRWEGGGLSVGTSPSGLGRRDARLERLGATEAAAWLASFETYWQSSDFQS